MKKSWIKTVLVLFFAVIIASVSGCSGQLGETRAEGHRRHKRIIRIQHKQIAEDIDAVLLFDRPSRLSEIHMP